VTFNVSIRRGGKITKYTLHVVEATLHDEAVSLHFTVGGFVERDDRVVLDAGSGTRGFGIAGGIVEHGDGKSKFSVNVPLADAVEWVPPAWVPLTHPARRRTRVLVKNENGIGYTATNVISYGYENGEPASVSTPVGRFPVRNVEFVVGDTLVTEAIRIRGVPPEPEPLIERPTHGKLPEVDLSRYR
jgi:hypothetical protein